MNKYKLTLMIENILAVFVVLISSFCLFIVASFALYLYITQHKGIFLFFSLSFWFLTMSCGYLYFKLFEDKEYEIRKMIMEKNLKKERIKEAER